MHQTIACPACKAPTAIDGGQSHHRCDYCAFEFIYQATHAAASDIERAAAAALEPIRGYIDGLLTHAQQAIAAGDDQHARALVIEYVSQLGKVYRETNYYQLMGVSDDEAITRYEKQWVEIHLASLAPQPNASAAATPAEDLNAQFTAALTHQSFDTMVSTYRAICRRDLAQDPRWSTRSEQEITLAVEQALANIAINTPWVSDAQLESLGIRTTAPITGSDGRTTVSCGYCHAALEIEALSESVVCEYCGATTRIRLQGAARYHARGHANVTDGQAEAAAASGSAHAQQDLDAALAVAASMVTDVPNGSPKYREKLFYFAAQIYPWVNGERKEAALAKLGLRDPRACRTCEQEVALATDGDGRCPLCGA